MGHYELIPVFCSYVAESVMWRWLEQPLVPSNRTLVERHISYRAPGARRKCVPSSSPPSREWPPAWPSTPNLARELARIWRSAPASPVVVAEDTYPGHVQAVRSWREIVMWRSSSKNGGILGINWLEAT
jgi:hypothetical protein